jgi:thiamine biosynthesis lipoprotein
LNTFDRRCRPPIIANVDREIYPVTRARPLLGTIVEITARSPDRALSFAAIDCAFKSIEKIQRKLSFHDRLSLLSEINLHAANRPVSLDSQTFRLLQTAQELYAVTSGIFDITIAPQLERNRFLPRASDSAYRGSFADVDLSMDGYVRFRHKDVRIDLGGIAKGLAVADAVAVLRTMGVEAGCVNAGGDLEGFGDNPIPIRIRDPGQPGNFIATIQIRNRAVATSAHYFANRIQSAAVLGPFVDPRTSLLSSSAQSVTVIARDPIYADALTKVVMIDPDKAATLLPYFNAAAMMVDWAGAIVCTSNWYASIQAS